MTSIININWYINQREKYYYIRGKSRYRYFNFEWRVCRTH